MYTKTPTAEVSVVQLQVRGVTCGPRTEFMACKLFHYWLLCRCYSRQFWLEHA